MLVTKRTVLLTTTLSAITLGFLAACNSGSGANANNISNKLMDTYIPTPLHWEKCDDNKYGVKKGATDYFKDRLECTIMQAPLNYQNIKQGTINIAVSRVKASNSNQRIGVLFFNPGGPGGRGIPTALGERRLSELANPGTKFNTLAQRYDYIGFDPRGVGKSTQLNCKLNQVYQPEMLATQDQSQNNLDNIYHNQILDAIACQSNKLTPYINSDATARDMDLLRQLLGEEQINYYGYSYGTWLGVWYASLFPERVNHMVLDSTVNFNQSLSDNDQSVPLQFVFDQVFIPYASQHNEVYNLGNDITNIRNIFSSLNLKLQTVLSDQLYLTLFYEDSMRDDALGYLMVAKVMNQLLIDSSYTITSSDLMAQLTNYSFTLNKKLAQLIRSELIPSLIPAYFKLANNEPKLVDLQEDSVNKAVTCNDGNNSPLDPDYWNKQVYSIYKLAPAFFHDRFELNCTNKWTSTVKKPDIHNAGKIPNIVMVQAQYDPATPLNGALATYKSLGNVSLVYKGNSSKHGVFPSANQCIDSAVIDYLIYPVTNRHSITACDGMFPPRNNVISTLATSYKELKANDVNYLNSTFSNPSYAESLIAQIHDEVITAQVKK